MPQLYCLKRQFLGGRARKSTVWHIGNTGESVIMKMGNLFFAETINANRNR